MLCDPPSILFSKIAAGLVYSCCGRRPAKAVINLTHHLIDNILEGGGNFDAHDDLAFPLPVTIIAQLLGVPDDDLEQFKYWSDIQVAAMGAADPPCLSTISKPFNRICSITSGGKRALIQDGGDQTEDLLAVIAGARDESGNYASEVDALSVPQSASCRWQSNDDIAYHQSFMAITGTTRPLEMLKKEPTLIPQAVEESLQVRPTGARLSIVVRRERLSCMVR